MKLAGREAVRFCAEPDTGLCGALIHGQDEAQVAAMRQRLVGALMGAAPDDLRLTRLDAAEARRDAALIDEAMRARGFFAGRPIVLIEGGTDGHAKTIGTALDGMTAEDGFLIVTAGALAGRSALRALFEGSDMLVGLHLFADAVGPEDVAAMLRAAGLTAGTTEEAARDLAGLSASMDYGSFAQLVEIIALFGSDAGGPLSAEEISRLTPAGLEAELGDLVDAVAAGEADRIGLLLQRLAAGSVTAVTILIALQRHFRQLLGIASAPGGVNAGIGAVRPPLWGRRRDAVAAQMRLWNPSRLEQANRLLFEADSRARSTTNAPTMALVERCALRLAIMARR